MAKKDDSFLKGKFLTNAEPTQQDFADLIDSKRNSSDKIKFGDLSVDLQNQINAIQGGQVILPQGATTWLAPAGIWINAILFVDDSLLNIKVGTTDGGDELVEAFDHRGNYTVINTSLYFAVPTAIFFTGVSAFTQITIKK